MIEFVFLTFEEAASVRSGLVSPFPLLGYLSQEVVNWNLASIAVLRRFILPFVKVSLLVGVRRETEGFGTKFCRFGRGAILLDASLSLGLMVPFPHFLWLIGLSPIFPLRFKPSLCGPHRPSSLEFWRQGQGPNW